MVVHYEGGARTLCGLDLARCAEPFTKDEATFDGPERRFPGHSTCAPCKERLDARAVPTRKRKRS